MMPLEPQPTDAVLGPRSLPPAQAAILGGVDRLQQEAIRLSPDDCEQHRVFFIRSLQYGDVGRQSIIEAIATHAVPAIREIAAEVLFSSQPEVTSLQGLLARSLWRYADEMTLQLLLKPGNHPLGQLTLYQLRNYPRSDLARIDQLWRTYSDDRFGLSRQAQIWQQLGTEAADTKPINWLHWCRFGAQVGWCDVAQTWLAWNDVQFSRQAPVGHLPRSVMFSGWGLGDYQNGCRAMMALQRHFPVG